MPDPIQKVQAANDTFAAAVRGLVDREVIQSRRYAEQQHRAVRVGAHPGLLEFEQAFQRKLVKMGIPCFVHELVRTPERQEDLYALGVTKARAGLSAHQYGLAFDLVHSVRGWNLRDKEWQVIGHVGMETAKAISLKVVWGGDDPGVDDAFDWDPAHWEIADWPKLRGEYPWR